MPYQSKTYSLSDEVIAAIEAARAKGLSPNKFLRQVLRLDEASVEITDENGSRWLTPREQGEYIGRSRKKGSRKR